MKICWIVLEIHSAFKNIMIKKNKFKRNIIIILVITFCVVFIIFSLIRPALSREAFTTVMEEHGYEMYTDIDIFIDTFWEDLLDYYILVISDTYRIEFLEFEDSQSALAGFRILETNINNLRGNLTIRRFINGINFNRKQLTTGGYYYEIIRINNIIIFGQSYDFNRNLVRNIIRLIETN